MSARHVDTADWRPSRDAYAMAAFKVLCAGINESDQIDLANGDQHGTVTAKAAYRLADAMIEEGA